MKKKSGGKSGLSKEFGRQLKRARGADPDLYGDYVGRQDFKLFLEAVRQKSDDPEEDEDVKAARWRKRFDDLRGWQEDPAIKARRAKSRGLRTVSIRRVAELMGISKNTLLDFENGVRYPPIEFVYDFCAALKVHPDELVTGWITNHPNENVRQQKNLGYINNFFLDEKGNFRGQRKYNVIRFITAAIRAGVWYANANHLSEEQAGKVAVVAASLMQQSLASGREIHPDSIVFERQIADQLLGEEYLKYLYGAYKAAWPDALKE